MKQTRWFLVMAVVAGLGLVGEARAQSPAPPKLYVDKTNFKLPIRMANQGAFKEFLLYMKETSGQWVLKQRAPSSASHFTCQVPLDGEYWFTLVAVDHQGRPSPADMTRLEPQVIVVVNTGTTAPTMLPDPATLISTTPEKPGYRMPEPPTTALPNGSNPPMAANAGPSLMQTATSRPAGQGGLVNSTKVAVDYNVAKVGTSGIGRIDIFVTPDGGQTWQRVGEDSGTRSPVAIQLPGEGVWGIRLVAFNGNGLGGRTPVAGEKPGTTIEVDLTGPAIHNVEIDAITKKGSLDIRWKITDKNLGGECVSIYYAASPNGPWQPMGQKLKNDGRYSWPLPRDISPQFFVRLEATDLAGNVSRFDLRDPLVLDTVEPDLNIINVSPIQTVGHRMNQ